MKKNLSILSKVNPNFLPSKTLFDQEFKNLQLYVFDSFFLQKTPLASNSRFLELAQQNSFQSEEKVINKHLLMSQENSTIQKETKTNE